MFDVLVAGEARLNPARALVTLIAVALGIGLWLTLDEANDAVLRSLRAGAGTLAAPVDLRITEPGRGVAARTLAAVRALPEVRSAQPVVEGNAWLGREGGPATYSVRVAGVDLLAPLPGVAGVAQRDPGVFEPGSFPFDRARAVSRGAIVLSARVADALHLRAGALVRLSGPGGTLVLPLVFRLPGTAGVDSSVAFVDAPVAAELFAQRGFYTRIDCLVNGSVAAARARISRVLPIGAGVGPPQTALGSLGALLESRERDSAGLALVIALVALALLSNGVASSVAARRAEIGTLRALGAARGDVFRAFVAEGALYGAIGSAFGVGLAIVCAGPVAHALLAGAPDLQIAWSDLGRTGIAFAAGIAAATGAAVFPALTAMRVPPARLAGARGFEMRLPWLTRSVAVLARPLERLGPAAYLASRELTGSPQRAFAALAAFVVAVGAAVDVAIVDASTRAAFSAWAQAGEPADLVVRPAGAGPAGGLADAGGGAAFSPGVVRRVRSLAGVGGVATQRSFALSLPAGATTLRALGESGLAPGTALLTTPLAARLHVTLGDRIRVPSPTGAVELRIAAVRSDVTDAAGSIVVDASVAATRFRDPRSDELDVSLRRAAQGAVVRGELVRALAPLRLDIETSRERRAQLLGALAGSFALSGALEAVTLALSVCGLVVTLAGVVLERRREFALLRHLGASRGFVLAIVRCQALFLCAAGCVAGTVAGALAAWLSSPVAVAIPFARIAAGLAATVVAVALAAGYPARVAAAIAPDAAPAAT
jgi:putative ABC transport system permease protein